MAATPKAGFARPDLTPFCGLDDLGLEVAGQRIDPERAVLTCRVVEPDLRCRCCGCEGAPGDSVTRGAMRWALVGIAVQHLTVARVAEGLGLAWGTANNAVLAEGRQVLIDDEHRLDGVAVDEHVWRHAREGDNKYVTVIIDLSPVRDGTGPGRLLDMAEGRSKQAFKTWLAERDDAWRDGIEVDAMDGFTASRSPWSKSFPTW